MQKSKLRPLNHPSNPQTRYKEPEQHTGEMFMTEKVFLLAAKRTQNSCSPPCLCVLCAKKTNPKLRPFSRPFESPYARKSLSFAYKTRIKPAAERGGFCRTMAENGGFCRTMWRKMAHFVHQLRRILYREGGELWRTLSGLWRIMADFVVSMWRIMAHFIERMPFYNGFSLCPL